MKENNWSTPIVLVVLAGIVLQVLFIFAAGQSAPHRTAKAFAKAYFKIDPAMTRYLCADLKGDEEQNPVADYRYRRFDEARQQGFAPGFMKSALYHLETETEMAADGDQATVRVTAERRTAINPIYAWVAKLFYIGDSHPVDERLELVREDGAWKVCGNPFGLAGSG